MYIYNYSKVTLHWLSSSITSLTSAHSYPSLHISCFNGLVSNLLSWCDIILAHSLLLEYQIILLLFLVKRGEHCSGLSVTESLQGWSRRMELTPSKAVRTPWPLARYPAASERVVKLDAVTHHGGRTPSPLEAQRHRHMLIGLNLFSVCSAILRRRQWVWFLTGKVL